MALSLKVVGALLIGVLLIIPAAAVRVFSRTPVTMAWLGGLIGAGSSVVGVMASVWFDTPAGAGIVVAAGAMFLVWVLVHKPGR